MCSERDNKGLETGEHGHACYTVGGAAREAEEEQGVMGLEGHSDAIPAPLRPPAVGSHGNSDLADGWRSEDAP